MRCLMVDESSENTLAERGIEAGWTKMLRIRP